MIVIVGAGICGLGIGWHLARAGREVTLFDRGDAGRGASWAAGGMLAPRAEAEPGEEGLLPLLLEGRALWPAYAQELEAASGLALGYRDEGILVVAPDRDEAERLRSLYDYHRGLGLELQWLNGLEARRLEPHLSRNIAGAVLSPEDHQVDNRKVVEALKRAFVSAGGILRENCPVDEIMVKGERAVGVRSGSETTAADCVVLAAGAWSRDLPGLPEAVRPPVRPLKGQMLALRMGPGAPLLRHVLWVPDGYLIPRDDGRLLVGGTVEEMGFDDSNTAGGLYEILKNAWEALPGIYDLPLDECWAGFRPASRDDAPLLGPSALEGLVMATGHHRNGVLLAPITAQLVGDFILGGRVEPEMEAFLPTRFSQAPAGQAAAS